jgi:hypothetical protein
MRQIAVGSLLIICTKVPQYVYNYGYWKGKADCRFSDLNTTFKTNSEFRSGTKRSQGISSIIFVSGLFKQGSGNVEVIGQRTFYFAEGGGYKNCTEPVFINLLRSLGIDSQPGGPVRKSYLSHRPARQHRLVESMSWKRFLGSLNVYKYGLCTQQRPEGWSKVWEGGSAENRQDNDTIITHWKHTPFSHPQAHHVTRTIRAYYFRKYTSKNM